MMEVERPPVIVSLKSSSQPKGGEGWEESVTSLAQPEDVDHAVAMALRGREKIMAGVKAEPDGIEPALALSLIREATIRFRARLTDGAVAGAEAATFLDKILYHCGGGAE